MKKLFFLFLIAVLLVGCAPVDEVAETALKQNLDLILSGDSVRLTNKMYTEELSEVSLLASTLAGNETNDETLAGAMKNIMSSPSVQHANVQILSGNVIDKTTVIFDVRVTAPDAFAATALKTVALVNDELEKEIDIPGYQPIKLDRPNMSVPVKGPSVDLGMFDIQLPDSQFDVGSSLGGIFDDIEKMSNELGKEAHEAAVKSALDKKERAIEDAYSNAKQSAYEDIKNGAPSPFRTVEIKVTMQKIDGAWKLKLDTPLTCALFGFSQTEDYGYSMVDGRLAMDNNEHTWEIKQYAETADY